MSIGPISRYDQWKLANGEYDITHDDDCDCEACDAARGEEEDEDDD